MRLLLVYPTHRPMRHARPVSFVPPLGLGMVAAVTPPDVRVTLTDAYIEPIDYDRRADLVAITGLTPAAPQAYRIADEFRRRGAKVVMGGMHATVMSEEALEHVDAVVQGEAELVWPRLVSDFKAGRLERIYRSDEHPDMSRLPWPRRDLFNTRRYVVRRPIESSRGCPFRCMYCSDAMVFGDKYRFRPVEDVVEEIRANRWQGRYVFFVDNNIVGKPTRAKELFEALIPLRIRWTAQASITVARDPELVKLAARSGCKGVLVGLETLRADTLREIGKPVDPARYKEYVARLQKAGIWVQGEFIFGFDDDDPGVFERTLEFAMDARLDAARFAILKPYPGTRLYREWDAAGRIETRDWSRYHSENVTYRPATLTAEELTRGRNWAYDEFGSLGSIWKRIGFRKKHWPLLWLVNLGNRSFKNTRRRDATTR